ncbi:MAG: hypothetical protein LKJ83_04605 [Eubacteriaceae bacterium]|jgi:chorismate mutase/prephenate dehydratase|nr:hypothetical protein [Eubacteriaceae bacterium]
MEIGYESEMIEENAVIACPGTKGAYSQKACGELFACPDIMYFRNFEAVFKAVDRGLCDYGILPIENSTCGAVRDVCRLMPHYSFRTVRSVRLRISHDLLAPAGTRLEDIREIISHEQALGQCRNYIRSLGSVKITKTDNTASAARMIAGSGRTDIAAIASRDCADLYGLEVLAADIQLARDNCTRFICIAKKGTADLIV